MFYLIECSEMRIGCLHTAESNIAVFDAAGLELQQAQLTLHHTVRSDLLAAAEQAGGLTAEIIASTRDALLALCRDNDAVILTCSTLGPAATALAAVVTTPVFRVDQALAVRAVAKGGRVVVLCAVETTLQASAQLFLDTAKSTTARVETRLVPQAWKWFKSGDMDAYLSVIARAADGAYLDGADVVALAQASMMPAAGLVQRGPPPMTSPVCGLQAAIHAVSIIGSGVLRSASLM